MTASICMCGFNYKTKVINCTFAIYLKKLGLLATYNCVSFQSAQSGLKHIIIKKHFFFTRVATALGIC